MCQLGKGDLGRAPLYKTYIQSTSIYWAFIVSRAVSRSRTSAVPRSTLSLSSKQLNLTLYSVSSSFLHKLLPRPSHKAGLPRPCTFLLLFTVHFQIQLQLKLTLFYMQLSGGGGLSPQQLGAGTNTA